MMYHNWYSMRFVQLRDFFHATIKVRPIILLLQFDMLIFTLQKTVMRIVSLAN